MSTIERPPLRDYVERLSDDADYQMLYEGIEAECARLLESLVMQPAGAPADKIEALRGEIRGMLKLVEAPAVARRVIKERRER